MTPSPPPEELPAFLAPLARRIASGRALGRPLRPVPPSFAPRRSAVLVLIAGGALADARLLLEERSHTMRSQPGQYALPGGRAEPEDLDDVHTALRESHEETGLDPELVRVIGHAPPIPMPWRNYAVTPVIGWTPAQPDLTAVDPAEVASVLWAPLAGPGSLTDPAVRRIGLVEGAPTGPAFDLPGDAFVWGFTAMIVEEVLGALELERPSGSAPPVEVPALRRRAGL